jgi:hypothetical protein
MIDRKRLIDIMVRFIMKEFVTEEESRILQTWLQQSPAHREIFDHVRDDELFEQKMLELKDTPVGKVWAQIRKYFDDDGSFEEDRPNKLA